MALILDRYLLYGNFTGPEAQLVATISKRLFQLHKQAAQTKRIIEFFHVSKSGGTSFCQLGKLNGCNTEDFGRRGNCLISYFRDHPRWTKPGVLGELSKQYGDPWCARYGRQYSLRWHCRARRHFLTRMRYTIYANELVMHDHNRSWAGVHPCREFLNVVIFREPEARVVSHMQNIIKEYVNFYNASFWTAFDAASSDQWRALAPPVFDNYVVRSLLGGQAYNMPYGTVNETHLLAAKIVALQFEVLLSLTPQTSELTQDIFGLGLGWHFDLRHLHARPTEHRAIPVFPPAVMDAVRAGRVYDQQLYEFALALQFLDALVFGIAHEVGGVGVAGAVARAGRDVLADDPLPVAPARGVATGYRARRKRICGYVGIKKKPRRTGVPPAAELHDVEKHLPVVALGAYVVAGGRWFNGTFYRNATEAKEAAVAAAREALVLEAMAAEAEAELAAYMAAAAARGAGAAEAGETVAADARRAEVEAEAGDAAGAAIATTSAAGEVTLAESGFTGEAATGTVEAAVGMVEAEAG